MDSQERTSFGLQTSLNRVVVQRIIFEVMCRTIYAISCKFFTLQRRSMVSVSWHAVLCDVVSLIWMSYESKSCLEAFSILSRRSASRRSEVLPHFEFQL